MPATHLVRLREKLEVRLTRVYHLVNLMYGRYTQVLRDLNSKPVSLRSIGLIKLGSVDE